MNNRHSRDLNRRFLVNLFLTGLTLLLPLGASATTHEVLVLDPSTFMPSTLTIEVGDTVRWVNAAGGNFHDVTADDFSFASPTARSFTFEMTFNSVAQIQYHCTVHSRPASQGGTRQNGTITVAAAAVAPDISIESVDVTDGAQQAGEAISVDTVVRNAGDGASGAFTISVFASTDNQITQSDTLLGSIDINDLAAGASVTVMQNFTLPANLPVGDYFIGAISNFNDANMSNDINVDAVTVFVFVQFIMNAGLNDAWFNPLTDGQGFFITVFADLKLVTLAWFTYDTILPAAEAVANLGDPGHRWLTTLGPISVSGDTAVMEITITKGGLFDSPTPVTRNADGTITLQFSHCKKGQVTYNIPSIAAQGVVPIQRIANDNVALCEALLRQATLQAQ